MAKPVDISEPALTDEEMDNIKQGICGLNHNHGCIQLCQAQLAKAIPLIREEVLKEVEKQIWKSSYILPTNKPKVSKGIKQALDRRVR